MLQYNALECKGLSQSDFAMISSTTVSVDQENGTLIVHSLLSQGWIEVQSVVGEGSVFSVYLPV